MKYALYLSLLFSVTTVHADSFDVEWAKFQKDFERLNQNQRVAISSRISNKPLSITKPVVSEPFEQNPSENQEAISTPRGNEEMVLKESDKLGYQVTDPGVREKVMSLYKRPDVIVQQYVIPFN